MDTSSVTKISLPSWVLTPETKAVCEALSQGNIAPRLVGGCVRDILAGASGADIDIATALTPEEVMARLSARGIKVVPTGIDHGTVTAVLNHIPFEITTLRKDTACDGRHAKVTYTDNWEEDAARRDFTINAMSMTIDGTLYDYFGGREDLAQGIVRFVGDADARVREDYLRILRFFRFYARFGRGSVDKAGLAACSLHQAGIDQLSGERIQQEMLKLLQIPGSLCAISLMVREGIASRIIPGIENTNLLSNLLEVEKEAKQKKDVNRALVRLAALVRGALSQTKDVANRWKLSRADAEHLDELCNPRYQIVSDMSEAAQKAVLRQLGKPLFMERVLLTWAEEGVVHKEAFQQMLTLAMHWEVPEFPVQGKDILALGIAPGKQVGDILKTAEAWWEEEGYAPDKAAIVTRIRRYIL
ncbi:MAG: tRNA nucleotidyltransferase [Rickettsiales bacterium]|jgi:poly(A) polymerase|nr:tRNA nucleotidyltransferase [Rickettsiales bacterium]